MEGNDFIVRLKANGSDNDLCDLKSVVQEYKVICDKLRAKEKGPLSLNVLCILCRNLDKVPTWRDRVDGKTLLVLSIDCVRETRTLTRPDQVKVLACIYHIHKHVIKLTSSIPPEMVLKLSYMPFEGTEPLLEEYSKTYWNILVDRLVYVEKLKVKHSISKLLPQLINNCSKVIQIYDTVQFCNNILTFLVKKLYFLYNESNAKELCKGFTEIIKILSTKDFSNFRKMSDKDIQAIYVKLTDCFYIIAESASKTNFKEPVLKLFITMTVSIVGHNEDIRKCLDIFFLNGFNSIFDDLFNAEITEKILTNIMNSCISIESNGRDKLMSLTYPFINQMLRVYIEYSVANIKTSTVFLNEKLQRLCLNLIMLISSKKTDPQVKCEGCKVKSGFHDSLRLLFYIKHFPKTCVDYNININNILPTYNKLVLMQHKILYELKKLGCSNHEKCFRKIQTDIHNTAIILNKAKYYDYSIKLFNIYIEVELRYFKDVNDLKNVSRALYNKSICELDYSLHDDALHDGFLSLIFSLPDGLSSVKYMSLIMDIKAKYLKINEGNDGFQMTSILESCKKSLHEKKYGNLKPFLIDIEFSELLKHEFSMYSKLWPSILPIAGVWRSLNDLLKQNHLGNPSWIKAESLEDVAWVLYEVVVETPSIVRSIHNDNLAAITRELTVQLDDAAVKTAQLDMIHAALLFLECEFDLSEASNKHGWKASSQSMDPDQAQAIRTIPQEHEASKRAVQGVHILRRAVRNIETVPQSKWLRNALQIYQVTVLQLLHLYKTVEALQLADSCCQIADYIGDSESYVINATTLISHAEKSRPEITRLISKCSSLYDKVSLQTALCFMCDTAIYYSKCGSVGVSARIIRSAQAKILQAHEQQTNINLDVPIGRLSEAIYHLCGSSNALSAVSGIQRHYLGIPNTESKWCPRRLRALSLKLSVCASGARAARVCRALLLRRRARCACAVSLPAAAAAQQSLLFALIANTHVINDAQTKVDNRLKYILGLQPSSIPLQHKEEETKPNIFTPKHDNIETMLENVVLKKTQTSPSIPCTSVYGYRVPEFFSHENCACSLCSNPHSFIIASVSSALESSMYFRAKELDIAKNYFEGSSKTFDWAERKLKSYFQSRKVYFDSWLVDMVESSVLDEFRHFLMENLMEAAFFELSQGFLSNADDLIVRIHEVMQDVKNLDPYLKNEVLNLVIVAASLRKGKKDSIFPSLESEMESLKLSPKQEVDPPKTPELKPKEPPKITRNVVKNEELLVKRKVIKLNLDDVEEKEVIKPSRKRTEFKIPVPITSKPVPENITPRTRPPRVLISKPTLEVEMTPQKEFFTPISTPGEEFFTPMSSIKTYSKKSLRSNIVKNLEADFSTPKADKENSTLNDVGNSIDTVKSSSRATRSKIDKRGIRRATSPGKLEVEKPKRTGIRKFPVYKDKEK